MVNHGNERLRLIRLKGNFREGEARAWGDVRSSTEAFGEVRCLAPRNIHHYHDSVRKKQQSYLIRVASLILALGVTAVGAQPILIESLVAPDPETDALFGHSVASVPDLDGDGYDDLVVGTPLESANASQSGAVHVFSGQHRTFLYTVLSPVGEAYGLFGYDVAGTSDLDGDGRGDLIIGAPYEDVETTSQGVVENAGRAYVFSGATGEVLTSLQSPVPTSYGQFGFSVSSVPDTNSDGFPDVLVGAWGEVSPGPTSRRAGHAYLFSGDAGDILLDLANTTLGRFGWSVSGVPDTNGDGLGDLLIGAWATSIQPNTYEGRAYLYSGANGQLIHVIDSSVPQYDGGFGYAVVGLPDINGDARGDLLIGAWSEFEVFDNAGRAYVVDGSTGITLFTLVSSYPELGGRFGSEVAWIPDVDGDGVVDLFLGAIHETGGDHWAGKAHLFNGATGAFLLTFQSPTATDGGRFGQALSGISDLDGDGRGEILIGASGENEDNLLNAGHVFLYSSASVVSNSPPPTPRGSRTLGPVSPNPFNSATKIRYTLPESAEVRLVVYDVLGRQVSVLFDGTREAGTHEVVFDADGLPSGTYLYRLETPQGSFVRTMLLMK